MSDFVVNGPATRPASPGAPAYFANSRHLALHLVGIAALAFVLVTSDAFGSDDLSLGRRILMFGVVSTLLVVQASILADAARRLGRPSFIGLTGAAALAVAATLVLITVEIDVLKATPIVPYSPDPLPEFALFLLPFVVPVSALVLGLKWSGHGNHGITSIPADAPVAPAKPALDAQVAAFGDTIDDWPGVPVQRVRAVDHYLQLWTSRGTMLVRGRMRDALRRLPPAAGIQPHRSWWVALSEIDRLERRGRDLALLLRNGDRVPVARAHAAEVKRLLGNESDF